MTGTQRRKQIIYQRRVARRAAKRAERAKQFGNFDNVFTFENLYASYKAIRTKLIKSADGVRYCANALTNLQYTYEKLKYGKYKFRPLRPLKLRKRGKQRDAWISCAEDRVVLYCLTQYCLKPIIEPTLIFDCSSGISGKGPEFAMLRFEEHLHAFAREFGNDGFLGLIDVSNFYPSIDRDDLFKMLRRLIKDQRILRLLRASEDRLESGGLLLGAPTSTILSALYFSEVDHYVKDKMRFRFYARHGDDIYFLHHDKEYVAACMDIVAEKADEHGLKLHPKKTKLVKLSHGWRWLKVRWWMTDSGKIIKKMNPDTITHTRQKLKKMPELLDAHLTTEKYKRTVWQSWLAQSGKRKIRNKGEHKFKHRFQFNNYYARVNMANLYYDLFPEWEGCPDVLFQIDSQERRYTRSRAV